MGFGLPVVVDDELDVLQLAAQVHGDLDHGEALEQVRKFFRLVANELLRFVVEMAMPRGDFNLHGFGLLVISEASWLIAAGILLLRSKPAEQRSPVAA